MVTTSKIQAWAMALPKVTEKQQVNGPDTALSLIDGLDLDGYYLFHAIRADLFRRLARTSEAAIAYDKAIARTKNSTERNFLQRRRQAL